MEQNKLKLGDLIAYCTATKKFVRIRNYIKIKGKTEWLIPIAIYCFDGISLYLKDFKGINWYDSIIKVKNITIKNVLKISFFVGDVETLKKLIKHKDILNDCMQKLSEYSIECDFIEDFTWFWSFTDSQYSDCSAMYVSVGTSCVYTYRKSTSRPYLRVRAFAALSV
jgi:hypothetical protein